MSSDTPRTDNSVVDTDWLGTRVELVNADFARKLECEIAALRSELKRQHALWQATHALGLAEREFAIKCIETALRKEAQP